MYGSLADRCRREDGLDFREGTVLVADRFFATFFAMRFRLPISCCLSILLPNGRRGQKFKRRVRYVPAQSGRRGLGIFT